jgi:putative tricarboxylic transport membrane protein
MDTGLSSWRAIYAPKGVTPAQIAYWQDVLGKLVATDEWKRTLEVQQWAPYYMPREAALKYMDANYKVTRSIMTELGLAK